MTAALEGDEWSAARSGRTLSPGKTRYPLYRRLGGPQGRTGRGENLPSYENTDIHLLEKYIASASFSAAKCFGIVWRIPFLIVS